MPRFAVFLTALLLAQSPAGKFSGNWSGATGASGDFHITLEPASGGAWKCEVAFTLGEAKVTTKITSVKVDGAKVRTVYEFDLGGNKLESTIEGELGGDSLSGKYKTRSLENNSPVDEGTFQATRPKGA